MNDLNLAGKSENKNRFKLFVWGAVFFIIWAGVGWFLYEGVKKAADKPQWESEPFVLFPLSHINDDLEQTEDSESENLSEKQ